MNRTLPHFLRFTRALALVSGVAVLPGCGGEVDTGEHCGGSASCAVYDGGYTGTPVFDGSGGGTVAYDGGPTGTTPAPYDGAVTGTPPAFDAGIVAYDAGIPVYDSGPVGVPIYDAGADVAIVDASSDVIMGGGPLSPPDLPA